MKIINQLKLINQEINGGAQVDVVRSNAKQ